MFYPVKTPWLFRKIYPAYIWRMDTSKKEMYLTFDDGPHPEFTVFVLDELRKYNAKATFFCIGENVADFPDTYRQVIEEGHAIGNHTQHHYNGWRTGDSLYLKDIAEAAALIDSSLFRPPYGKITSFQYRHMPRLVPGKTNKVVMWDVVSGDFDTKITPERCLQNVIFNAGKGSIVVFHDSEKAFPNMRYALPRVLEHFLGEGFVFKRLENG